MLECIFAMCRVRFFFEVSRPKATGGAEQKSDVGEHFPPPQCQAVRFIDQGTVFVEAGAPQIRSPKQAGACFFGRVSGFPEP